MKWIRCAVVVALMLTSVGSAQERDELLATPKFQEGAKQPAFAELTAEQVVEQITMTSGRNYAYFGFNTPEIHLVLPAFDNSVYADIDFPDPVLFDASGAEVPYERERGLYDHETHHDELRFMPVEGEEPVAYDRAVGTVTIRYPLRLHTIVARKGEPPTDALDVSFDGPFVARRSRGNQEGPEVASFTGIDAFRVMDASGKQLEAYPSVRMNMVNGVATETKAFWGEAAEVQIDAVDEWVTIQVSYELPSVDPLPKSRSGIAPDDGDENPPTPGAKVVAQVIIETPGMIIAAELGVTPDEAVQRLKDLRFPQPSGDYMVMSAGQGKTEAVKLFLAAGFPIDYVGRNGTALSSAVMSRQVDLALFLVEAGADVNIADSNNATPLFHAAGNCQATELVRALIDAGADPTPATRGGTTAPQYAEMMGCTENAAIIAGAVGN